MVDPTLQGSEDHVTVVNVAELKKAITWGVYRAMWYWFLTWLVIAVVPGALFLAISIPKFAGTKESAYEASMRTDLRNLVTAEEAYFADSVKYTSNLGTNFAVTTGNVLGPITLTRDGWTATITNINSPKKCAMFIGNTPIAPARREGEPLCE